MSGPQPFVFQAGAEVKRHAPATERNRDVIAKTLARLLPAEGLVLEVASGTGEHVVHFAKMFPALTWQPSDTDPIALASINAWRAESDVPNVRPAMLLDASADWPISQADAVICINMTHYQSMGRYRRSITQGSAAIAAVCRAFHLRTLQPTRRPAGRQQCCFRCIVAATKCRMGPALRRGHCRKSGRRRVTP